MALGETIARLSVHLGLETAAFEKGTKRATKEVGTFEKNMSRASNAVKGAFVGMLGAFAVDQIVSATKASLDYAGSLGEVAQQLGVNTNALQSYRFIASQVGIEQDDMDKGLAKLSRTIGAAAQGNKSATALFEKLGISIRDSNGHVKAAEDILPQVADAYNRLGSEAEKSALASDVFGSKLGSKLNPALALGSKGIADMAREANELGLILTEEMIENADTASDTITKLSNAIKMQFTAAVAGNAKEIGALANELINLISTLGSVTKAWRGFANIRETEGWWEALKTDFDELGNYANREDYVRSYYGKKPLKFKENLPSVPGKVDPRFLGGTGMSRKTPFSIAPKAPWPTTKAMGASAFGGMDMSQFTPGQGEGFIRMAEGVKEMVPSLQLVDTLTARINMQVGAQLVRNFQEAAAGALNLAGAAQSVMDRLFPVDARRRQYIDELALLRSQYDGTAASAAKLAEAEARLRNEWILSLPAVDSLRAGLGKYMDAADQAATKAEQSNQRIGSSYASMASNVGGIIGQLIGGKTGRIIGGIFSLIGQAAPLFGGARAAGGPVIGGRAYLVGEKGPELMIPGASGMVIPNHAMPQLVAPPSGSRVSPGGASGGMTNVQIIPSPYFQVVVDGRIQAAAPSIASAGASGAVSRMQRDGARRVA